MGPLVPVHHPKVLGAEPRSEWHTGVAGPQGYPHLALSHQVETAGFTDGLGAPAHAELGEDVAQPRSFIIDMQYIIILHGPGASAASSHVSLSATESS